MISKKKFLILILAMTQATCNKIAETSWVPQDYSYTEILGRPTTSSVVMNFLCSKAIDVYWEWGTSSSDYTSNNQISQVSPDRPLETVFSDLNSDTRYYYRIRYRVTGSNTPFTAGPEHFFQTCRKKGSLFTFSVEADPHLDDNSDTAAYALTLQNVAENGSDFFIDLGDTFFSEKQKGVNQNIITARHLLYRPFFGKVCHSSPLFLVMGNHEGESGWLLTGTSQSIPVMAANTRKTYYPNPLPDNFYSGDEKEEPFTGLRQNYYSWEWGDALFVVLDPYWYTATRAVTGWEWTLGADQYDWFSNVLTSSTARYKFVFCHNLVGGNTKDARGGAEYADYFEMGGSNSDGSWGFDSNRPGWGKPLHTLMKENHVTIFFHGHDHFYGKQEKDGIIYQEVPQPSNKNITNISAVQYGYVDGLFLPGRGYLRINVSSTSVKVEYVRTYLPSEETGGHVNNEVADTYIIN